MKVVINVCFGGFSLSEEAEARLKALGLDLEYYRDVERHDPRLVQVVEELGREADGGYAELKAVEIPDGIEYTIEEYDGNEHVAEAHRTWS